jgi:hypothetical protein
VKVDLGDLVTPALFVLFYNFNGKYDLYDAIMLWLLK